VQQGVGRLLFVCASVLFFFNDVVVNTHRCVLPVLYAIGLWYLKRLSSRNC